MTFIKITEKLNKYQERLKKKEAKPIKRKHVEKVINKLKIQHANLKAELKDAKKPSKYDRILANLKVVEELQSRADWLLEIVGKET